MDITCIILGLLFCVLGILFASGKLHNHIDSWNKLPDDEKEKIRIEPLCRNIGEVFGLSGLIFLLNGFNAQFKEHWFVISMIAWFIITILDLCFIEKSGYYERK